ncbi:hypothetical protein HPP92_005913 [Vanilla planifolia]|uniref:Uncharacterized protein n=1 Tax=Vanilla planifolia TaxID=51239 RepID=A0A835RW06_VANPL|nr:hypothetical protein HPP92_006195 [Vanilla planifolia]KAG0494919.1 hypothetical protein HPP92_005913 [Vanilla planifolia]
MKKEVGWSWVGCGGGEVELFVAAGREHPMAEEVYEMLKLVDFGSRMVGREEGKLEAELGLTLMDKAVSIYS